MSDQKPTPRLGPRPRIREVIDHYDSQEEDERAAADSRRAWEAEGMTLMSVPTDLVPRDPPDLLRRRSRTRLTPSRLRTRASAWSPEGLGGRST